ncbi:hypothetical protein BaRGS_00037829, partial [Batillaria attramentaria]
IPAGGACGTDNHCLGNMTCLPNKTCGCDDDHYVDSSLCLATHRSPTTLPDSRAHPRLLSSSLPRSACQITFNSGVRLSLPYPGIDKQYTRCDFLPQMAVTTALSGGLVDYLLH